MSANKWETQGRALKVEKLVNSATFANDMLVERGQDWPKDIASGLFFLADMLAEGHMWDMIGLLANVAEASETTRLHVVEKVRAQARAMVHTDEDDAEGRALLASF